MPKKPHVILGLPTMSTVHTWLLADILSWMSEAYRTGEYNLGVCPTLAVCPVDRARNQIVEEFLANPEATHLFFVDADTIPPQDALLKLLRHNQPIVSGLTPIIECDPATGESYRKWNCVGGDDKHLQPNTGIHRVRGAGGSCIMIKREVFEKMPAPWYSFLHRDDTGKKVFVSEDLHFIARAMGLGIPAYCDTSVVAKHYKSTVW